VQEATTWEVKVSSWPACEALAIVGQMLARGSRARLFLASRRQIEFLPRGTLQHSGSRL
jgi:hypothetical protein